MKAEFENYLAKHKTEPFIMLDEMNLTFEEFVQKFNESFPFRKMWQLGCDFNYYEIRGGKCQHAKIIHGKIVCSLKGCN